MRVWGRQHLPESDLSAQPPHPEPVGGTGRGPGTTERQTRPRAVGTAFSWSGYLGRAQRPERSDRWTDPSLQNDTRGRQRETRPDAVFSHGNASAEPSLAQCGRRSTFRVM